MQRFDEFMINFFRDKQIKTIAEVGSDAGFELAQRFAPVLGYDTVNDFLEDYEE